MQGVNSDLEQVYRWIYQGDRAEARVWLEESVSQPDGVDASHVELLMTLNHQDMNYGAVTSLYGRFEKETESSSEKSFLVGNALLMQGQRSKGIDLLQLSRSIDENSTRPRIVLYRQYTDERNFEIALEIAEELASIQPDNSFFRVQLARSAFETRDTERAIHILKDVVASDSMYVLAHKELIRNLMSEDRKLEARERIDAAKVLFEQDFRIRNLSARLYYRTNNFAQAAREWEMVIYMGQQTLQTHINLGLCYYQLNSGSKALQHFEHVLEQEPEELTSLMYAAVLYREKNDLTRASELLNVLYDAQLSEFFIDTLIQRAVVNEAKDQARLSEKDYLLALKLDSSKDVLHYYLGFLYDSKLSDREQAKYHYSRFVESKNGDPGLVAYANSRIRVIREEIFFRGE
ncbi:MAG: hypothetical protein LAT84_00185 [Balneolia bacterium]|nr:hypothetical protein [Balneolia bacterium]